MEERFNLGDVQLQSFHSLCSSSHINPQHNTRPHYCQSISSKMHSKILRNAFSTKQPITVHYYYYLGTPCLHCLWLHHMQLHHIHTHW